ncbi:four-carbon acid sugar kinase family protein [Leucobacter ruminantium]|uniref:Four-carbon acid sugar kinase family protein n=1 Tax=Leucobacter ruminantium TaxID=1289170 RepID=A0A939LTA6_9MICO|nr:four-carbon acid sugar kinase family protein [Leucobacter ruminantium]MBO1804404.1 four-carbon acid sugar kinase family protein [Leucobacter ruminantium]
MGRIGFLADDLTGAADVLAQAHARGLDAVLSLDPAGGLPSSGDVVGIAGPTRSLEGRELEEAIDSGLAPFSSMELDVFLYKVCSTFDSSPTTGSIGCAIERLAAHWPDAGGIPVVPAQPEFGRYTAFSQHFGSYGNSLYRLDRHPVMSRHPSTPMREADLRLVLREQAPELEISEIHLPAFTDGSFAAEWADRRSRRGAFVVDAVAPRHLDEVARALLDSSGTALVVGSGGIMAGLARTLADGNGAADGRSVGVDADPSPGPAASGPVLAVSASASATTAAQISDALQHGWVGVEVPPGAIGRRPEGDWWHRVLSALEAGEHVVAHTANGPEDPRLRERRVSSREVGGLLAEVAAAAVERGLTRDVAIFGGDSSSHALLGLNVSELRVTEQFVTAGPICAADAASDVAGCRLLLKGGQVGPTDILRRFAGTPARTERWESS